MSALTGQQINAVVRCVDALDAYAGEGVFIEGRTQADDALCELLEAFGFMGVCADIPGEVRKYLCAERAPAAQPVETDIEQARECDVERVARALFAAELPSPHWEWSRSSSNVRDIFKRQATAAITAMQPTIDAAIRGERERIVAYLREQSAIGADMALLQTNQLNRKSFGGASLALLLAADHISIDHDPGEGIGGAGGEVVARGKLCEDLESLIGKRSTRNDKANWLEDNISALITALSTPPRLGGEREEGEK